MMIYQVPMCVCVCLGYFCTHGSWYKLFLEFKYDINDYLYDCEVVDVTIYMLGEM